MGKKIARQPKFGTFMTMLVGVLLLFLMISQAGKYHQYGFIKEKAEERAQLIKERKKAMLTIGLRPKEEFVRVRHEERILQNEPEAGLADRLATTRNPSITSRERNTNRTLPQVNRHVYRVRRGDTLYGISLKIYGDGNKWRQILKANSLRNPSSIVTGMRLSIPAPRSPNNSFRAWIRNRLNNDSG